MSIKEIFKRKNKFKKSFSQTGEDVIMNFIFNAKGIKTPSYIDIGAYKPIELNNTYLFYLNGSRGINIEPHYENYKEFNTVRPRDLNLNIGIASNEGTMDFFIMNDKTMSTFDFENSKILVQKFGFKIEVVKKVKVKTLSAVIDEEFNGKSPDILSIDVEGLDFEIIKSINFDVYSPNVICVETIEYSVNGTGKKNQEIPDFLYKKGYILFADTYINSIFVKKEFWQCN